MIIKLSKNNAGIRSFPLTRDEAVKLWARGIYYDADEYCDPVPDTFDMDKKQKWIVLKERFIKAREKYEKYEAEYQEVRDSLDELFSVTDPSNKGGDNDE